MVKEREREREKTKREREGCWWREIGFMKGKKDNGARIKRARHVVPHANERKQIT